MTRKEKTTTAHGEVSYETVSCSSCGQEIPKESADRFVVGSVEYRSIHSYTDDRFDFADYTTGWACSHCKEHDPVGYPQHDGFWKRLRFAFGALKP